MALSPNRHSVTMRQAKPPRPTIRATSTQRFRPEPLVRLVSPAPSPPSPTVEKTAPPTSTRVWLVREHLCAALRADGLRLGERQAAVGQDQGRAAHDPIPQVWSRDSPRELIGQQPEAAPPCPFPDHSSQHQFNLKQTF